MFFKKLAPLTGQEHYEHELKGSSTIKYLCTFENKGCVSQSCIFPLKSLLYLGLQWWFIHRYPQLPYPQLCRAVARGGGGLGGLKPAQFLADQLTLSQPGGGHILPTQYYEPSRIFRPCDGPEQTCLLIIFNKKNPYHYYYSWSHGCTFMDCWSKGNGVRVSKNLLG